MNADIVRVGDVELGTGYDTFDLSALEPTSFPLPGSSWSHMPTWLAGPVEFDWPDWSRFRRRPYDQAIDDEVVRRSG